jgi:type II secretory pathway component PulK
MKHRRSGFVLVVVLGTVLALCAILCSFNLSTRMSLRQADSFYQTEQAWHSAWAGLALAAALVRDANDSGLDPQVAHLFNGDTALTVGDANCAVVITGENGLLNVNRLTGPDGKFDRPHVDQFLRLIDVLNRDQKDAEPIGYGLVPAMIDWIDADDDVTCLPFVQRDNLGAENDYYQGRTPPRSCRNAPVDALEELADIKGMTPAAFERLRPCLTCVGDGKIDLNAAPQAVLQSLSEQMDAVLAETIVQQRKLRPFGNLADLRGIPGMTDNVCRDLGSLGTVSPSERFYHVTARGQRAGHCCTIEAVLRRNTQAGMVDIIQYREL